MITKSDYATAFLFIVTMIFSLAVMIYVLFVPPADSKADVTNPAPIVQCYKPTYFERVVLNKQDTTDHILCRR